MAKARLIARSLGTSERYAGLIEAAGPLSDFCMALYPLLVVNADDFGRLEGSAFTVRVRIFPITLHTQSDFEAALTALEQVGLIQRYDVNKKTVIQIVQFDRYQRGLHKRTESEFPDPDGNIPEIPHSSGKVPEVPPEPNPTEPKRTKKSSTPSQAQRIGPARMVKLWNESIVEEGPGQKPPPRVLRMTAGLRKKIDSRLQAFPSEDDWRLLFAWINRQAWCRAGGEGKYPDWTASLDWVVRSDDTFRKHLDTAKADEGRTPVEETGVWKDIKDRLGSKMDARAWSNWVQPTTEALVKSDESGMQLVVSGPSYAVKWLQAHYLEVITSTASDVVGTAVAITWHPIDAG